MQIAFLKGKQTSGKSSKSFKLTPGWSKIILESHKAEISKNYTLDSSILVTIRGRIVLQEEDD